jgi:hypothetical protein
VLADICRTFMLPLVKTWPGCEVLILSSAARNFSCRAVLLHALLVLASWFHARTANTLVGSPPSFLDSVNHCCSLAHDVLVAYPDDARMIEAASTLLSMFSRERHTVHCVIQRRETRRLIFQRLQERLSDTSCACVLMSVLRDCSSFAHAPDDSSNVFTDLFHSPCISAIISSIAQFNKVVIDSRTGSQTLRGKANLLLNAASGLVLNLSTRALTLGANDALLMSGLVKPLSESAASVTSSLTTSCNCISIVGRLLNTQSLREQVCGVPQHCTQLVKWLLAVFHEHTAAAPRALLLAGVCALLESAACITVFFKSGGMSIVSDAVRCLATMRTSSHLTADLLHLNAIFSFAAAAATSSFANNPAHWLSDLHSSGHLRLQSLFAQVLSNECLDPTCAAATAALMLLVIPHPSPSYVRPPSCTHVFGNGPVASSDHACWLSPISGVHVRCMSEQVETDRVAQALRAVMAFCATDDLSSESSRMNIHKHFATVRAFTSRTSVGSGGSVADPNTFHHLSRIFATTAGLIGHVAYKLAFLAGRMFREKLRKFKQAEEFLGIEDEHALLNHQSDIVEETILQRVTKLRSNVKSSDYPAHLPMLIISSEEVTGINPDDLLRQYGEGGSVALVHSGKPNGNDVTAVFLGFSETEKKPIPFLPPPPHFGDVPPNAAVEGSVGFYKRHRALGAKMSAISSGKIDTIDTVLASSNDNSDGDVDTTVQSDEVSSSATDTVRSMELHSLDSSIMFTLRHVSRSGAAVVRPVLNLAQSLLQLEAEWDHETFASASNTFRGNTPLRDILVKILLRHTDDVSIMRPCLATLCLIMQSSVSASEDQHKM